MTNLPTRWLLWSALLLNPLLARVPAQSWREWLPISTGQAIAYDATRGGVLLFGGNKVASPARITNASTWWFDGQIFTLMQPLNAPSPRYGALLTHDAARGRTVLYGGETPNGLPLFDTWEHDGTDWIPVPTATTPPDARGGAMVFHQALGKVVLLTGIPGNATTWHYDGVDWQASPAASWPAPRSSFGLAHDAARQRVVAFGGVAVSTHFAETWEYDGVAWQLRPTAHIPLGGQGDLVYDTTQNRIAWHTPISEWWHYDGVDWALQPTVVQAPFDSYRLVHAAANGTTYLIGSGVHAAHTRTANSWLPVSTTRLVPNGTAGAAAYDTRRGRVLVHGANVLTSGETPLWSWQGDRWVQLLPLTGPSPRPGHGFVHDEWRDVSVLFGGEVGGSATNQTWQYSQNQWTLRTFANAPTARKRMGLAWDPLRRRCVLFGGVSGTVPLGDTWTYDGTAWTATGLAGPPARSGHGLVYDAANDRFVLYGGEGALGTLGDTWTLTTTGWQQLPTTGQPGPRLQPALAYDPTRGAVVLSGGRLGTTTFADTWELRGTTWTALPNPGLILPHFDAVFVADVQRARSHLIGGFYWLQVWFLSQPMPLREHQVLLPDAVPQSHRHGTGCAGSAGVPVLDAAPGSLPALGTTFSVQVQNVPSAPGLAVLALGFDIALWQGVPLPVRLDALGLPGCHAWIAPSSQLAAATTNGNATFGIGLPNLPQFAGTRLAGQALVLDASAASSIGAVSNALVAILH